eukprot:2086428-Prymnesium_polylepis.2
MIGPGPPIVEANRPRTTRSAVLAQVEHTKVYTTRRSKEVAPRRGRRATWPMAYDAPGGGVGRLRATCRA